MTGNNEKLFSEGPIGRVLLKFSIPAVLSLLVTELYNMVDTVFVGREIGGEAIGALVVVFPIQRIVAAISMMLAIGASTSVARRNGEHNEEGMINIIQNAISLAFLIVVPFMLLVFIFRDSLLRLLGASENILPYAHEYLQIIIWGSIFITLTTTLNYIMMSLGNRRITMISTASGAILNGIIDYILVRKLQIGVTGAAIATLVSQMLAFTISFMAFRQVRERFNLKFKFKLKKTIARSLLAVGFAAFIVEAEDGILIAFLNNLLLNNVGEEGVVILGVISKISMFMFITMLGIGSAMQPIAAYNLGAKNYKRLKKVARETLIFAFLTSVVLWILTFTFSPQIVHFITKAEEDPSLVENSVKAFRLMVAVFPLLSIYYVSIYYYQAIGKARESFLISIFRQIIVLLPVSIITVKFMGMGARGVWIAYPISDGLSGILSIVLMRRAMKKLDDKIEEEDLEENLELSY